MSSTNIVNFSLRQNKSIERAIAFDCINLVMNQLGIVGAVYVGFGSVWFEDFVLAHRFLGIETMVSIERDPVIFKRAIFNRPYRTVEILDGDSSGVIPSLLQRPELAGRPWVVWLDHDRVVNEDRLDELVDLISAIPPNSFLLITFSAQPGKYGSVQERPDRIRNLFGDAAPEPLNARDCKEEADLARILAKATEDLLLSKAIQTARPGAFVPAVNLTYKDSVPMVTVGGVLPSAENYDSVESLVANPDWPGRVGRMIDAPPLTPKEVMALQSMLPSNNAPTRQDVQKMGFDLEETHLTSYVDHYLRYPQFAQVAR
ncbi:MAG: hypothetical protein JO016_10125 [Actinobacteria bacterium]|nr:hypothetical protein [Actinomycetota bacterium]